ncbi:HpcH/HpaI aldolase family protein [Subtercola lobariae]|uniref:Siderophore biosynthesis protein SbnG n=1 Tax=Subtercola lobariae TaxID=1588641 RepID=A0A917EV37_9MICO|nr:aldolase/citrate lyase family protein [Subtercola lobariae]GGF10537.1 siderophore biosynthesis protein SbnG [Subtercola lobariae]
MITFASLLEQGTPALGTWVKLPVVESIELMSVAGFGFVVIDLEHSPMSFETAATLIAVGRGRGLVVLVRVPDHGYAGIQRCLDAGASGIVVPHVDSVDEARAVNAAARFEPKGKRGVGPTSRAGDWGLASFAGYLASDADVAVIAQIESMAGVNAVGDMLADGSVDAVLVGAADLSVSLGLAMDDPGVTSLISTVLAQCQAAGVPCGTAIGADGARAARLGAQGFGFVLTSNDATMLGAAGRAIVTASQEAVR